MNRTLRRILAVLLLIAILIFSVYYDAFYRAPDRLSVRYQNVTDTRINSKLNGLSICFFSDLHYGAFTDEERVRNCIEKINEQNCDIVVFLGDLIDQYSSVDDETSKQLLIEYLSQIKAPYGKFAIYGNHDLKDSDRAHLYEDILYESGFELLVNQNMKLSLKNNAYINLVALDCQANGNLDLNSSFSGINSNSYTIVVSHTPDTIDDLTGYDFDLMLAGHTHGGQVVVPIVGPLYTNSYGARYTSGLYSIDNKTLYVTNGVGTTSKDVRLFAEADIVVYHFYNS